MNIFSPPAALEATAEVPREISGGWGVLNHGIHRSHGKLSCGGEMIRRERTQGAQNHWKGKSADCADGRRFFQTLETGRVMEVGI